MAKAPTRTRKAAAKTTVEPTPINKNGATPGRKRLTVGSELTEQEPFLGQVEIDEYTTGEYGEQIHLAVRPLEFVVAQDKTGQFHEWYKPSTKTTSKCGALLAGLKAIGVGDEIAVGENELVGTVAYFVRRTIEFGKDRQTGEVMKAEDCLLPFGPATDADVARAKATGGSANKTATPEAPEWSDDEIAAVIKLIEGKKQAQFQIAAARSKLAPELKNAVLSGAAVKYLLELDVIEVSKAGVVTSKLDEEEEDPEIVDEDDDEDEDEEDEDEEEEEEEDEVPV